MSIDAADPRLLKEEHQVRIIRIHRLTLAVCKAERNKRIRVIVSHAPATAAHKLAFFDAHTRVRGTRRYLMDSHTWGSGEIPVCAEAWGAHTSSGLRALMEQGERLAVRILPAAGCY